MTISNRFAPRTSTREFEAALDEVGGPGAKAPKKIPVGITPKPKQAHRVYRLEAVQARKTFCEIDKSIANGVKAQVAMQVYAEDAYATVNPEDEIIDMIDRKHDRLGALLCAFADRTPRRTVHHT